MKVVIFLAMAMTSLQVTAGDLLKTKLLPKDAEQARVQYLVKSQIPTGRFKKVPCDEGRDIPGCHGGEMDEMIYAPGWSLYIVYRSPSEARWQGENAYDQWLGLVDTMIHLPLNRLSAEELAEYNADKKIRRAGSKQNLAWAAKILALEIKEYDVTERVIDYDKSNLCPTDDYGYPAWPPCEENIVYREVPAKSRVLRVIRL